MSLPPDEKGQAARSQPESPTPGLSVFSLAPDQKFGSFTLLEKLGTGGIGEVWKARDWRLNRIVALKFIVADEGTIPSRYDLLREARSASALNHPNIITIFEVGQIEGRTFLAMEYVEGETLRGRLKRFPLPMDEVLDIAEQAASGLAAAHRQAIVHRDLKPENIMLRIDGYVKLLDFGLAKLLPWAEGTAIQSTPVGQSTETGQLVGTFTYMSPEQARGLPLNSASDVFSFGIVLHEIVTGEHPFRGPTVLDTLNAILSKNPQSISTRCPGAPPRLAQLVSRALQREVAQRYPSAVEVAEELKKIRLGEPSAVTPAPGVRAKPRWMQALGAALIAGLLLMAVWFLRPSASAPGLAAPVQSLAVMTLRTAPEDTTAALLAQGLPEDLSSALAAAGLSVAAHSSVLQFPAGTDPREMAGQLGVEAILSGSVRSYGTRFRVHVELMDARSGFQLWSGTFTIEAGDLLATEQDVAGQIAKELRDALAARP